MSTDHPQPRERSPIRPQIDPVAGVLGFILPGLGHARQGQTDRALRIGAGVLGLFFFGILVGGIDVVDRREDRMWFVAQAAVGPLTFAVDHVHQTRFKGLDRDTGERRSPGPREIIGADGWIDADPTGRGPRSRKSVGKVNELGTLFCAVAGMMNAIAILDASFPSRRKARADRNAGHDRSTGPEPAPDPAPRQDGADA